MTRQILAIFACSFLTVSLTIPALAREANGTVVQIDEEAELLTLDDGSLYALPAQFDYAAVRPGMHIHVIYESAVDEPDEAA